MSMLKASVVACLLWSGSASTASPALPREQALRMIRAHPVIKELISSARIGSEGLQAALRDGIVAQPGAYEVVTDKGKQYFTAYSMLAGAKLVRPVRSVVSAITGIRDSGEGTKIAEFVWHIEDLDAIAARYTLLNNADQSGEALFRLYDDGWRIVTLKPKFKGGLANSRPLVTEKQVPRDNAAAKAQADICAMAIAWSASATDFNTYYLYEYRGEQPPLAIDTRKDGLRTTEQIRRALVPTYMSMQTFPATDPYGSPYIFEIVGGGSEFLIISRGPDGKQGGGDDLINSNGRWLSPGIAANCY